ncbi:MAG: nitroreductase [Erysipelotrichaceae bacterium]|jgi:nitroreductase|nr:nitroreductase [Erysipelotrichaceae bacterium]
MLKEIEKRVSVRDFKDQAIEKMKLDEIVRAGRFAPSGKNAQLNHFIVIQDEMLIETLNDLAKKALKREDHSFFYNAKTVIIVANSKHNRLAVQDASCALMVMMIEATSQGLGSCWINQVSALNDEVPLKKKLLLNDDEVMIGALIVGYEKEPKKRVSLVGNHVTYL